MFETIVVAAIILAAVGYMARVFYRIVSGRRKACGCEDKCPISPECDPNDESCVVADQVLKNVAQRGAERAANREAVE
jgi:hypothetical protein